MEKVGKKTWLINIQWIKEKRRCFYSVCDENSKQYIILKVIDRMKLKVRLLLKRDSFVFNYRRLEKKQAINSWKCRASCDAVLNYEIIRRSQGSTRRFPPKIFPVGIFLGQSLRSKTLHPGTRLNTKPSSYNRNKSDDKSSLKRQRTPENTTYTQDVSKFYWFYV